jgi:hypothetical protein
MEEKRKFLSDAHIWLADMRGLRKKGLYLFCVDLPFSAVLVRLRTHPGGHLLEGSPFGSPECGSYPSMALLKAVQIVYR